MNTRLDINIDEELEIYAGKLETLSKLAASASELSNKDYTFASDLINTFMGTKALSSRQWYWVEQLANRVRDLEPIYGNFAAVVAMMQLAAGHIEQPKIRLMSKGGTFIQLNYNKETGEFKVYIDGWQGHGYRKFAGWIKYEDGQPDSAKLVPYRSDRLNEDVANTIQDFSLDPVQAGKAHAGLLGCCVYCGHRLSDEESKRRGYGPTCASNYGLPWGTKFKPVAAA